MNERKSKIVITEYEIPGGSGLTLIESHEALFDETDRISIIVTMNSSDSAIMLSAEGAADAFVLKPFSTETFQQKLSEVLDRKAFPTLYDKKLQDGRKLLKNKNPAAALEIFTEAQVLDPKPAMACYLKGLANKDLRNFDLAFEDFKQGQKHQPLHYRCLTSEFDLLIELQKYDAAAKLIPLIRHNFPVSESRLGQFFIASVFTYHFDELADYYRLALELENRSEWISELMSLAFMTAGKFWLKKQNRDSALTAFEFAVSSQGKAISTIDSAVDELLKFEAIPEAQHLLEKVLPADVGSPIYAQIRFKIDLHTESATSMIESGRRLISEGLGTPEIFRQLVRIMAQEGKETLAESMIAKARELNDNLATELYEILKRNLTPARQKV